VEVLRIPETVLSGKFHNKRSVRKQRTRGNDVIQRDALQISGITRMEEGSWG
jgi:hypothetical protein